MHEYDMLATTVYTLYNAILRIARNFLETRENIKIWGLRRKPTQKGILGPTLAERLT